MATGGASGAGRPPSPPPSGGGGPMGSIMGVGNKALDSAEGELQANNEISREGAATETESSGKMRDTLLASATGGPPPEDAPAGTGNQTADLNAKASC